MIRQVKLRREFHPFAEGETFDLKPITILVGDQGAGKSTMLDMIVKYQDPKLMQVNDRYRNQFKDQVDEKGFKAEQKTEYNLVDLSYDDPLKLLYVDTEKHNPRMTAGETTKEYKDAIIEVLRDEALHKIIQILDGYKHQGYEFKKPDNSVLPVDTVTNRLLEKIGLYFDSKRGGTILGDEIQMDITTATIATMQSHGQSIFPLLTKSTEGAKLTTILLDEPETALSIRSQHKILEILRELAKNNQIIVATHSPIIMQLSDEVLSLEHRKWMKTEEFLETQTKFN